MLFNVEKLLFLEAAAIKDLNIPHTFNVSVWS